MRRRMQADEGRLESTKGMCRPRHVRPVFTLKPAACVDRQFYSEMAVPQLQQCRGPEVFVPLSSDSWEESHRALLYCPTIKLNPDPDELQGYSPYGWRVWRFWDKGEPLQAGARRRMASGGACSWNAVPFRKSGALQSEPEKDGAGRVRSLPGPT